MSRDYLAEFETRLIGRSGLISRPEGSWLATFDDASTLSLGVPWRIVADGRIAFGSEDDGQMFGLPAPLDGPAEVLKLIGSGRIVSAVVDRETADLHISFATGARLDAFNNSAGYEGWQARRMATDGGWYWVIALGGGDVTIFAD